MSDCAHLTNFTFDCQPKDPFIHLFQNVVNGKPLQQIIIGGRSVFVCFCRLVVAAGDNYC